MQAIRVTLFALIAVALSACISAGPPPEPEVPPRAPVLVPELINVSISEVKIGEEVFLQVDALGRVPTGGWTDAQLIPVEYAVAPPNGIWDISFVVVPPPFDAFVTQGFVDVRAEPVRLPLTADLRGARVMGGDGAIERRRRTPG